MGKDEKIILALGFVGLAAIILYVQRPSYSVPSRGEVENENITVSYLNYNQPYLFAPPVANILPETASGILGQRYENNATTTPAPCGCGY